MPLAQEKRRRGQVEPGLCAGDREQRIQILLARPRQLDHFAIHHLLARQTDLAQQPPDRGMEPENTADQFFGQGEEPVAAPHVQNFMAQDGVLHGCVEVWEIRWQQHRRTQQAEGHRAGDGVGDSDVGLHAPGGDGNQRAGVPAQPGKPPETRRQPTQAGDHAHAQQNQGDLHRSEGWRRRRLR